MTTSSEPLAASSSTQIGALASRLVATCTRSGVTLATCESLTGGAVAQAITSVPGASAVLRGGLVTYASDVKVSLAAVDAGVVERDGVVNEPVARQMAEGARRVLGADIAVSCTGVAGPGPQGDLPAGTVWLAVAGVHDVVARELHCTGSREDVRTTTVREALALALDFVSDGCS